MCPEIYTHRYDIRVKGLTLMSPNQPLYLPDILTHYCTCINTQASVYNSTSGHMDFNGVLYTRRPSLLMKEYVSRQTTIITTTCLTCAVCCTFSSLKPGNCNPCLKHFDHVTMVTKLQNLTNLTESI